MYEVGRIFRNEGMDTRHNPEFTSVEMYQAYANYLDMMDLIEDMYRQMTLALCGKPVIPYGDNQIDMHMLGKFPDFQLLAHALSPPYSFLFWNILKLDKDITISLDASTPIRKFSSTPTIRV